MQFLFQLALSEALWATCGESLCRLKLLDVRLGHTGRGHMEAGVTTLDLVVMRELPGSCVSLVSNTHFLCLGTTSLLLSLKTPWCCKTKETCKGLWTGEKVFFAFHTQLHKERGRRELEEKSRKLRNETLHPARRKSKRAWTVSRRRTHMKFEGLREKKSPPPQVSRNPRVLSLKDGDGWDEW